MDKKVFVKELKKWLKSNQPIWSTIVSQKAGITEYKVQNDKGFRLMVDTPSHGVKDMYCLHMTLAVNNDEIFNIKNKAAIKSSLKFPIIYQGSSILYPEEYIDKLWFRVTDELPEQIGLVSSLINQYYFPVAKNLTMDYDLMLDNFDNPYVILGFHEPFITGVIMAFFCNREKWIYDVLLPLTKKHECFVKDFGKASNAEKEIIEPIRKCFG